MREKGSRVFSIEALENKQKKPEIFYGLKMNEKNMSVGMRCNNFKMNREMKF